MVRRTNVNGLIFLSLVAIITPIWFRCVDDCPSHVIVNAISYKQLIQCFDIYVLDIPQIAIRSIKVNKNTGILCWGDPYWILCFGITIALVSRESSTPSATRMVSTAKMFCIGWAYSVIIAPRISIASR